MNTLLKYRRLNRKRAGLSHKRDWYLIDALMVLFAASIVQFVIYSIIYGIR